MNINNMKPAVSKIVAVRKHSDVHVCFLTD
jgi:hypothetical protein